MSHIMAIDQGTSSSRVIIFDLQGRVLSAVSHEFDMTFPQDGWVEQDPEVLWRTSLLAGREALHEAGLQGKDVAAIGITNQRETTLVWDRESGHCLHPAIVWQDRRTADVCAAMRASGMQQDVARISGLVIDPYFSGTKLAWLLDNVADARRKAEAGSVCFGTVDAYLIWRLTKGSAHVTDATNASRTMFVRHRVADVVSGDARTFSDSGRGPAERTRQRGGIRHGRRRVVRRGDPDPRRGRRSAGGADRPGLLR